eukprot:2491521-Alexandrium_andersonii.AAC.1
MPPIPGGTPYQEQRARVSAKTPADKHATPEKHRAQIQMPGPLPAWAALGRVACAPAAASTSARTPAA